MAHDPTTTEPARRHPGAEREARRHARGKRHESRAERPGAMVPSRRRRLPLEAPLMRIVASAGIVGIAVVIAVIMNSHGSEAWLIGLATSLVSLVPAAVLCSLRRL